MTTDLDRIEALDRRVRQAADAAGHPVRMLLATKTLAPNRVGAVVAAGHELIGESRVQEVLAKVDVLAGLPHQLHFIGHLQSNKVNQVLPHLHCLQTLDDIELARRLDDRLDRALEVMVQVNVSGEASKSGVAPGELRALLTELSELPKLRIVGLMTIGLNSTQLDQVRAGYRTLAELRDQAGSARWPGGDELTELSMGMSGDFELAIAEGATMVRLGSAAFGDRPPRPSR